MDLDAMLESVKVGGADHQELADRMRTQMERLFPICRSISGEGVRQTLACLQETIPLQCVGVPTGTQVFDWTVNDEWNVRDAYILDASGRRVVDFRSHNLHLVGYSVPVRATLTLEELRPHLHTLPEHPEWIPYRTSYYTRTWGFCLSHDEMSRLGDGPFEVVVDSTLEPGELTYGELLIPGDSTDEVIISAHTCHPSIANDNLSGIAVATELARLLATRADRRFSYRFLFAPGTIGSLTWMSQNQERLGAVRAGLVLTGLGGPGPLVYKSTRAGNAPIDRAATHVVEQYGGEVRAYSPYGYDERQFNALGFGLALGRLTRTPHGEYPEYHTSADDLDYVKPGELVESLGAVLRIIDVLENDTTYLNVKPFGEPQLGKYGLYPTMGGKSASDAVMAMLWVLAYADGSMSLLDIAGVARLPFTSVRAAAADLEGAGLLSRSGVAVEE